MNSDTTEEVYREWIEATQHKGLTWHQAQTALEEIKRKRQEKADAIARRLLGKHPCITCNGTGVAYIHHCFICSGTGWIDSEPEWGDDFD